MKGTIATTVLILFFLPVAAAGLTTPEAAAPTATAPAASEPSLAACDACRNGAERLLPFTVSQPLASVAVESHALVTSYGGSDRPAPDALPGFDDLPEELQREAWRAWTLGAWHAALRGDTPGMLQRAATADRQPAQAVASPDGTDESTTTGLRSLWRLEGHGYPTQLLPADDEGGHFLLTSRAVVKFDGPGEDPAWMVKPDGLLTSAQVADANGDDVDDLVMGIIDTDAYISILFRDFFGMPEETGPSLVVLDGATGQTMFRGFENERFLEEWTLSDVDGDGALDVLAYTIEGSVLAATLDGTVHYAATLEGTLDASEGTYPNLWAFYQPMTRGFGDIDGDGVDDFVLINAWDIYAVGPAFVQVTMIVASTYSGTDGSMLWEQPLKAPSGPTASSYAFLIDVEDLDGDGTDDPLAYYSEFTFQSAQGVTAYADEAGYVGLSGADGSGLLHDQASAASVFAPVAPPVTAPISQIMWEMDGVIDLDGDGAHELITFEFGDDFAPVAMVGRAPGEGGGPSVEDFRVPMSIPAYDDGDGHFTVRDVDEDGIDEYVVVLVGVLLNDNDEIDRIESKLLVIDDAQMTTTDLPRLTAFYEYDERNGQAYGWTIEDDRFAPMGAEGNPTADGMRLVVSPYPIATFDQTRDGVPDLLLRKSMGVTWVDGRNGAQLEDVPRPAGRYIRSIDATDDRILLLEYAWASGNYHLTDLTADRPLWTLDAEQIEDGYLQGAFDVTGDGTPEAVINSWIFDEDATTRVLDVATGQIVWEISRDNRFAFFADVIEARAGREIVVTSYTGVSCSFNGENFECEEDPDSEDSVALYVPETTEPLWKFLSADDSYYYLAGYGGGYAAIGLQENAQRSTHVIGAENGTVLLTVEVPEETVSISTAMRKVNPDQRVDLALVYEVEQTDESQESTFVAYDVVTGAKLAEHAFATDHTGGLGYIALRQEIADWDGDHWHDVLVAEFDRPVIYSSQDGTKLASAAQGAGVILAEDFNRDGAAELGIVDDTLRLRLFTYDQAANETIDDAEFRVLDDPLKPQTDPGADDFFEGGGSPAPGAFLLAVALLTGLVGVRCTRR